MGTYGDHSNLASVFRCVHEELRGAHIKSVWVHIGPYVDITMKRLMNSQIGDLGITAQVREAQL